ncbi:hypothetical protein NDU88_000986 [Pleurodeles waltl]|uniref:Secreted protein n=1 Tax=Pleurodeles waltl TaxID=8319 RepID=A0AAV7WH16_PLEWA|nr:hypothetical protein NDU88_000986 [Pleurodeles waltl]
MPLRLWSPPLASYLCGSAFVSPFSVFVSSSLFFLRVTPQLMPHSPVQGRFFADPKGKALRRHPRRHC